MFEKSSFNEIKWENPPNKLKKYFLENFNVNVVIVFLIFLAIFFSIDILSKHFLFEKDNLYNRGDLKTYYNYSIIGVRSIPHDNSTIFSALNLKLPLWATYLINFSLAIIFVVPVFFSKSIYFGIIMSLIVGGILGNSIDKLITNEKLFYENRYVINYVRDILWFPWWDRGTFNIADIWIILGSGLLFLRLLFSFFKPENTKNINLNNIKNIKK